MSLSRVKMMQFIEKESTGGKSRPIYKSLAGLEFLPDFSNNLHHFYTYPKRKSPRKCQFAGTFIIFAL